MTELMKEEKAYQKLVDCQTAAVDEIKDYIIEDTTPRLLREHSRDINDVIEACKTLHNALENLSFNITDQIAREAPAELDRL